MKDQLDVFNIVKNLVWEQKWNVIQSPTNLLHQLFPSQQVLQKIRGEADIDEEYHNIKQSCLEAEREIEKRSKSSYFYLVYTKGQWLI